MEALVASTAAEAGTCNLGQGLDRDQAEKSFSSRANMVQPMTAPAATMTTMKTGWDTQAVTAMKEGGLLRLVRPSDGQNSSRNKSTNYHNISVPMNEKIWIILQDRVTDV